MAVRTCPTFEAYCDRCEIPYSSQSVFYTADEAYAAAINEGWLRQGDEAIYCADCVELAGAA